MRRAVLFCVVTACFLSPPAATPAPPGPLPADLDAIASELFGLGLAPGMGVAVVRGGEVLLVDGYGYADLDARRPVTPDSLFYVASTTKSFTAFAVALLDHAGRLDMDAPISRHLPGLELAAPLSADGITLRDLVTLTHGIEDGGPVVFRTAYSGDWTSELLLDLLEEYPPAAGGRAFEYGNLGYNVAGLVMEAALGRSWKEIVEGEVLAPAGMHSTTAWVSRADPDILTRPHRATPDGFAPAPFRKGDATLHAAGGHLATMLDLARWLEIHLTGGRLDGRRVFPAAVVAATHRLEAEQDREFGPFHRHGWGLGWDLGTWRDETLVHRFGGYAGYRSHVSFMPEHGFGVAVQVNEGTTGSYLADRVAVALYDRLLRPEGWRERFAATLAESAEAAASMRERLAAELEKRRARPQVLGHPPAAYTGTFENPALGSMTWRLEEGEPVVTMGLLESGSTVYDADRDELRVELTGRGQVMAFEIREGRAVAVEYLGRRFERADG